MKSDEEIKEQDPLLYSVARKGATEPAFTGTYVHEKSDGTYHCAVCGATLFLSATKFDSGSGWPSFTDPATREAVTLHADDTLGTRRTEVRCKRCDAHLGHVFHDGPIQDGKVCDRYCINSVSLDLKEQ